MDSIALFLIEIVIELLDKMKKVVEQLVPLLAGRIASSPYVRHSGKSNSAFR
jgi:hypothetical protein